MRSITAHKAAVQITDSNGKHRQPTEIALILEGIEIDKCKDGNVIYLTMNETRQLTQQLNKLIQIQ